MKRRKVCSHCGSDNVVCDAWASWDESSQEWVLYNVFDYKYCTQCEADTTIKDIPAEVTEEEDHDT